jgi:hypothetical protein
MGKDRYVPLAERLLMMKIYLMPYGNDRRLTPFSQGQPAIALLTVFDPEAQTRREQWHPALPARLRSRAMPWRVGRG